MGLIQRAGLRRKEKRQKYVRLTDKNGELEQSSGKLLWGGQCRSGGVGHLKKLTIYLTVCREHIDERSDH
jgi:hypothetical protein